MAKTESAQRDEGNLWIQEQLRASLDFMQRGELVLALVRMRAAMGATLAIREVEASKKSQHVEA